jgi:predicted SprT family Zn-dependent metalloprotease
MPTRSGNPRSAHRNSPHPRTRFPRTRSRAIQPQAISGTLWRRIGQWLELWGIPGFETLVRIRYNPRLRTTIARWVTRQKTVEVGRRFKQDRRRRAEVLCHELAHAAVTAIYGSTVQPHGPEWRDLVRLAGFELRASESRVRSQKMPTRNGNESPPLYEHRCPVCQSVRFGRKPAASWRCLECVRAGLTGQLRIRLARRSRANTRHE